MSDIKTTINEQLQQLQMIMHRTAFFNSRKMHNPFRGQGRVLAILKLKPEMSQKELTYLLNMSKQSVAELIKKLEKDGYVTREPLEGDKRMMNIKLTEKGKEAAEHAEDTSPENIQFLDCLNDDELAIFSGYLERIIKQYQEQFPDDDFEQRRHMMENFMANYGPAHHGPAHHGPGHHHGPCHGGPGQQDLRCQGSPNRTAYYSSDDFKENNFENDEQNNEDSQ